MLRTLIFITAISFIFFTEFSPQAGISKINTAVLWAADASVKKFYNETMSFRVEWKGIAVGTVRMKCKIKNASQLQIAAQVTSWESITSIYYVQGSFGSLWNYASKSPVFAYEEAFQGDAYQKRSFSFHGRSVDVLKNEKQFFELSYPHRNPPKGIWHEKYSLDTKGGYQDLLGAFYNVRSTGKIPVVGEIMKVPVLPAGGYRYLILKVLAREVRNDVPFFGTKEIIHVKSGLVSADKNKPDVGANVFFNTKSQIEMWITADSDFVPVKIWTDVPYLGRANILLDSYSQP